MGDSQFWSRSTPPDARPGFLRFLDLPADCSEHDVRSAYRRLAHQHHPDQGGDPHTFRLLSEHYQRALKYVHRRDVASRDFRAVAIDTMDYVPSRDQHGGRYWKYLVPLVLLALLVAWSNELLPHAVAIGVMLLVLVFPAIAGSLPPIVSGVILGVIGLAMVGYLVACLQAGVFIDDGLVPEIIFIMLAAATLSALVGWLISLAETRG